MSSPPLLLAAKNYWMDRALTAEVALEACQQERDAIRAALRDVADECEMRDSRGLYMGCRICGTVYMAERKHDDGCVVLSARALSASEKEQVKP